MISRADVLRHRIVLSYDALSEGVTADELLERVLVAVPEPGAERLTREVSRAVEAAVSAVSPLAPPAARQGRGRSRSRSSRRSTSRVTPAGRPEPAGRPPCRGRRRRHRARAAARRTRSATTSATSIPSATARTGQPHVRVHVPERALTTWIVLDVSPSMAFGTARRLKADVAEGAALVFGRLAIRRAGSVGLVAFGAGEPRVLPPRGSKPGIVALRRTLAEGVAPDGRERSRRARRRAALRVAARPPAGARRRHLGLS